MVGGGIQPAGDTVDPAADAVAAAGIIAGTGVAAASCLFNPDRPEAVDGDRAISSVGEILLAPA